MINHQGELCHETPLAGIIFSQWARAAGMLRLWARNAKTRRRLAGLGRPRPARCGADSLGRAARVGAGRFGSSRIGLGGRPNRLGGRISSLQRTAGFGPPSVFFALMESAPYNSRMKSPPPMASAASALPGAAADFPGTGGADWRVIRGDCLKVLPQLPDKSANMIFADPPYNLQLKGELWRPNMTRFNGVTAAWDKFASFAEYDSFCESWLRECRRILADDGTIWVIGTYHNIGRVARLMQDLGFWMLNDVIWKKTNAPPNFRGVRFANATETLVWAKKKRVLPLPLQSRPDEGGKRRQADAECVGNSHLRRGGAASRQPREHAAPDAKAGGNCCGGFLLSCTKPGDVVLDPFLGSGTTLAVARQLGRIGIGVERGAEYVGVASDRIGKAASDEALMAKERGFDAPAPRRVPFSELIRRRLVRAGQALYSPDRGVRAKNRRPKRRGPAQWTGGVHSQNGRACAKRARMQRLDFLVREKENGRVRPD